MTITDTQNLILSILSQYGSALLIICGAVIGIFVAYCVYSFGWSLITGRTGFFTSLFPTLDHKIYKPWKGYNRFRSREWNMQHTA